MAVRQIDPLQGTLDLLILKSLGTGDIVRLVAGKGITLTLAGLGIGALAAIPATRLMSNLLYGFTAADITLCLLAGTLLLALAAVASYVPARRASRLDQIISLRAK